MAEPIKTKEIAFTPSEHSQVEDYLIGSQIRPYFMASGIAVALATRASQYKEYTPETDISQQLCPPEFLNYPLSLHSNVYIPCFARVQSKEELMKQNGIESCLFKSAMSFAVGGALGGFLGLAGSAGDSRVQNNARETFIGMRKTISRSAKNFAVIGMM